MQSARSFVATASGGEPVVPCWPEAGCPQACGSGENSDADPSVLARLSRLPVELQDAVIRHLPLADILVWQRLNHNFHHRIRVGAFVERAVCRRLGPAVPWAGLTRDNYTRLLHPWLAGFSAHPLPADWGGVRFDPPVLFCAITRTLRATRQLAIREQACFRLPATQLLDAHFGPDGTCLVVRTASWDDAGRWETRSSVFAWDESGWHRGSAFTGESGVYGLAFSANGSRVAVVSQLTQILIHDRQGGGLWQQTACLVPEAPLFHYGLHMLFSPDGCTLVVQSGDGAQSVWDQDACLQWRLSGSFFVGWKFSWHQAARFSPDGRWLLMQFADQAFGLASRNAAGDWESGPDLVPAAESTPIEAIFLPDSQQLLLHLDAGLVSVWQQRQGQWSEQEVLEHPDGITALDCSPDAQQLLTCSRRLGSFLWTRDGQGRWGVHRALNRLEPGSGALYSYMQCFDPASRWLVAGHVVNGGEPQCWTLCLKDRLGNWSCRPAEALYSWTSDLAVTSDGQQLVVLSQPRPRQRGYELRILQLYQGRWRVKAERSTVDRSYSQIAADPFCCHLAAFDLREPELAFFRVEEVARGATGQDPGAE